MITAPTQNDKNEADLIFMKMFLSNFFPFLNLHSCQPKLPCSDGKTQGQKDTVLFYSITARIYPNTHRFSLIITHFFWIFHLIYPSVTDFIWFPRSVSSRPSKRPSCSHFSLQKRYAKTSSSLAETCPSIKTVLSGMKTDGCLTPPNKWHAHHFSTLSLHVLVGTLYTSKSTRNYYY